MDNDQQIREIFNYKSYLQQSFGIILDEETAARLWILKYAAIWRMVQNQKDHRTMKAQHNCFGSYSIFVTRAAYVNISKPEKKFLRNAW